MSKTSIGYGNEEWMLQFRKSKIDPVEALYQFGAVLPAGILAFVWTCAVKWSRPSTWKQFDFKGALQTFFGFAIVFLVVAILLFVFLGGKIFGLIHWMDKKWSEILYEHWRDKNPVYFVIIIIIFPILIGFAILSLCFLG